MSKVRKGIIALFVNQYPKISIEKFQEQHWKDEEMLYLSLISKKHRKC